MKVLEYILTMIVVLVGAYLVITPIANATVDRMTVMANTIGGQP